MKQKELGVRKSRSNLDPRDFGQCCKSRLVLVLDSFPGNSKPMDDRYECYGEIQWFGRGVDKVEINLEERLQSGKREGF